MTKQVLSPLRMFPTAEAVSIPFVAQFIDDDEQLQANDLMNQAADAMLDELARVSDALTTLRSGDTV